MSVIVLIAVLSATIDVGDYSTVAPIFAKHCVSCHGPSKQKSGLRLDRKADALRGGDSGPAFKPHDSNGSLLFDLASGTDNPSNGSTKHLCYRFVTFETNQTRRG